MDCTVGWKAAIDEGSDYVQRNRERPARWRTLRECRDGRAADPFAQRFGTGFDLIVGGSPVASVLERLTCRAHTNQLCVDGCGNIIRRDPSRGKLQRTVLQCLRRKVFRSRLLDDCENVLCNRSRQDRSQTSRQIRGRHLRTSTRCTYAGGAAQDSNQ
jgi:hypothetical protein